MPRKTKQVEMVVDPSSSEEEEEKHSEEEEAEEQEDNIDAETLTDTKDRLSKQAKKHNKKISATQQETERTRIIKIPISFAFALGDEAARSEGKLHQYVIPLAKHFPRTQLSSAVGGSSKPPLGRVIGVSFSNERNNFPVTLGFTLEGAKLPETVGVAHAHENADKPLKFHHYCLGSSKTGPSDVVTVYEAKSSPYFESNMDALSLTSEEVTDGVIDHNTKYVSLSGQFHPIAEHLRKAHDLTEPKDGGPYMKYNDQTQLWTLNKELFEMHKKALLDMIQTNPVVDLNKLTLNVSRMYTKNPNVRSWMDPEELDVVAGSVDPAKIADTGKVKRSYAGLLEIEVMAGDKK